MKSNSELPSLPTVSKKPRALPCVWMRFWHLAWEEVFFIGRKEFVRTGLFTARPFTKLESPLRYIAPWTRVKTTRLVRAAKPDLDRPRVEQPNSDNKITGPTS